jgi:hypothetical protein
MDAATPSNVTQQNTTFSNMSSALDVSFPYHDSTASSRSESWDPMMSFMQMDGFDMGMGDMASFFDPHPETDLLPEALHQSKLQSTNLYPLTPQTENNTSSEEERSHDPFLLLSKLHKDLYEWMLAVERTDCPPPWRINMNLESHGSDGHSNDSNGPANPTASFLRILSGFINALKLLKISDTSKEDGSKPDKASGLQNEEETGLPIGDINFNSTPSSLNMPIILMVMTTYLLFLRVYNILISRVCFVLETMPGEAANIKYDPGIQLGGVPLPQGLLHLKLILQVFEHQLVLIETTLGLPAEYRVHTPAQLSEGQQRPSSGLFSHDNHRFLLKSVMTEIGEGDQRDEKPRSDILNLRQNFVKLKDILQGSV